MLGIKQGIWYAKGEIMIKRTFKMSKEMRDVCLCMGTIGMAYALLLMMFVLFTGAKIIKSVMIIAAFSTMLFSIGLSPAVRNRLKLRVQSVFNR
ncbi:MAG: hypothetical protein MJK04_28080 [Psychrosphaera sp.]|nr:hypothetical protein [Psychrosphaera sp.]